MKNRFFVCFRCGQRTFEFLQTYGHCVNCLSVKEIRRKYERQWELEYRNQFSDQMSYQEYLKTGENL